MSTKRRILKKLIRNRDNWRLSHRGEYATPYKEPNFRVFYDV